MSKEEGEEHTGEAEAVALSSALSGEKLKRRVGLRALWLLRCSPAIKQKTKKLVLLYVKYVCGNAMWIWPAEIDHANG
ncbi:MAG: hypothetical protein Q8S73_03635 [Deltaproteobacteria bacterium]|nr:hypothetical protein [Deltaproteobacteria bacterium]